MSESLKNILLVMSSGGYLKRPCEDGDQSEQQKQLWNDTSNRLHKFLPNLMPELFPEAEAKAEKEKGTEVAHEQVEANTPMPTAEEKGQEVA